jgi:hypothetical protein
MTKIAVFGHSPDSFSNTSSITYNIDNVIEIVRKQHVNDDPCVFLVNCEPGIGQWFCNILLEKHMPYEVFLSYQPYEPSTFLSDEQMVLFNLQLQNARAVHVCDMVSTRQTCEKRDKEMIDACQWVLVFWDGKRQGFTYNAIKYAMMKNKIVFNGIDGINLLERNKVCSTK